MTSTLVDSDLESLVGSSARCSLRYVVANRPFCSKDAEWAVRLSCCGHIKSVCSDHQDIVASVLPRVFVCTRCHTRRPSQSSAWRI